MGEGRLRQKEVFCDRCRQWKNKCIRIDFKNRFNIVRHYNVCTDCIDCLGHQLALYLENHHRFQTWTEDRIEGGTPINDKPWTPETNACAGCEKTAKQLGSDPWALTFETPRMYHEGTVTVRFCKDCYWAIAYNWVAEQECGR